MLLDEWRNDGAFHNLSSEYLADVSGDPIDGFGDGLFDGPDAEDTV